MQPSIRMFLATLGLCLVAAAPLQASAAPASDAQAASASRHPTAGEPFANIELRATRHSTSQTHKDSAAERSSLDTDFAEAGLSDASGEADVLVPDLIGQFEDSLPIPALAFYLISSLVCLAVISGRRRQIENAATQFRLS